MKRSMPHPHTSTSVLLPPKLYKIDTEKTTGSQTVKMKFQHGTVITLIASSAETLLALGPGYSIVDPDPNDSFFKSLCHEVEASMGVTIENKPVEDQDANATNNPTIRSQVDDTLVKPLLVDLVSLHTENTDSSSQILDDIDKVSPCRTENERTPEKIANNGDGSDKEKENSNYPNIPQASAILIEIGNTIPLTSYSEGPPLVDHDENVVSHATIENIHSVGDGDEKDITPGNFDLTKLPCTIKIENTTSSILDNMVENVSMNNGITKTITAQNNPKIIQKVSGNKGSYSCVDADAAADNQEESSVEIQAEDIYKSNSEGNRSKSGTLSKGIIQESKKVEEGIISPKKSPVRLMVKVESRIRRKYREAMKMEMETAVPDMGALKLLMKDSFDIRRELIEQEAPVKLILRDFPALRIHRMIRQEFCQICKVGITVLIRKLRPVFQEIISKERNFPKMCLESSLARLVLAELDKSEESPSHNPKSESLRMNVCMVLFCIKQIGHFDPGTLYMHSDSYKEQSAAADIPTVSPFIVVTKGTLVGTNSSFDIYAERNKVLTTNSFFDAMLNVYMLYWIFWMEYQERTRPIFAAFDAMFPNGRKDGFYM